MRRILINSNIEAIVEEYTDKLLKKTAIKSKNLNTDNLDRISKKLKDLSMKLVTEERSEYKKYVENIKKELPKIIKLKPSEFDSFKDKHFNNLTSEQLCNKVPELTEEQIKEAVEQLPQEISDMKESFNFGAKKFYELIVEAMCYNDVQKTEIRPYMKRMGLNTCVYCNASYAVATDDRKATFQVDHYLPKSKYPFLCISFFNLYPACMHCNQIKGDSRTYKFCLYTEDPNKLDPFKFSIDDKSIIKYMLFNNTDLLKVNLKSDTLTKEAKEHFDFFRLGGLYSQFSDEIEEIIWKAKIYNKSYRNQLLAAYNKNFPFNIHVFKRFYLGFYPDAKDVHKRPLTLLKQSIAKEMGLE
jgi:hypothetical protein bfra3_06232